MRRIPRWLRGLLVGLAVFELAYVAAGVYLVQSGQVERWLNSRPEKRKIRFESAWTVIPGVAHVRGFRMTHQGRKDQIELIVDRAAGFVNPLELIGRRIHIIGIQSRGVEFRYRKRPKTQEEAEARAAAVPSIEGLRFEPYGGPPTEKRKKGWTIVFTGARVRDVRDVWIERFRLRGGGDIAASVTIGAGADKRVSIRSADVHYREGEILVSGDTAAEEVALRVQGRMEPFYTKQTRGKALLTLISVRVDLSGRGAAGTLLNRYFGKAGWLEFESSPRQVTARLELERGRLRPGGLVEIENAPLAVSLAGFIVEGQATARIETVAAEGDGLADAEVRVAYTEYGMRRQTQSPAVMKGEGLLIQARSPGDLAHLPPEEFNGRIEFGQAEFPDLVFMNELIPGGADITVKGGSGTVDGHFETGGMNAACQGSLMVVTKDLVLETGGVETTGNAELTVDVPEGNLNVRRFSLDNTRIELHGFAFASKGSSETAPDWGGRLTVTEGDLGLGEEVEVDARLELAMSDSRPLVAFLSRDKPLSGWKEKLLTIEEITGEGDVELKKNVLTVRHVEVRGERLKIRVRGRVGPEGVFGKALAQYGILRAGIGLQGRSRKLKLTGVGSWYQKDDIPGMVALSPERPTEGES